MHACIWRVRVQPKAYAEHGPLDCAHSIRVHMPSVLLQVRVVACALCKVHDLACLLMSCRDPEDRQIQRELRALKALIRDEKAASAKVFKGAFGAAPKVKADSADSSSKSSVAAAAAAAGEPGDGEISEADADGMVPSKPQAAAAGSRSSSMHLPPLLALAVVLIAIAAVLLGWLPGLSS